MKCLKRLWILLIFTTLLLCIFLWSLLTSTDSYRRYRVANPRTSIRLASSPQRMNDDTYKQLQAADRVRYYQLLQSYHRNLAAIPRLKYSQNTDNIVKGPPLSSVLTEKASEGNQTVKRILAWTTFFGKVNWIPKTIICKGEPHSCISVTDRSELANVDGIVVHPRDLKGRGDLPSKLLSHQRLIYLLQETPFSTGIKVDDYNGIFNWTSTYRGDSDSPFPLSLPSTKLKGGPIADEEFTNTLDDIMALKQKLVANMISNCGTTHTRRLDFIKDLQKHIPVDTYGACRNLTCPKNTKESTDKMSQYKFYLSMENAHCRDYISEKVDGPLWNWRSVPIVMGGADPSDYEHRLPPNSYIHIAGFSNVAELAEFLQILDRNPQLYARYHHWRKTHQNGYIDNWCYMCRKLHDTSLPIQYYKNFAGWYKEDVCIA